MIFKIYTNKIFKIYTNKIFKIYTNKIFKIHTNKRCLSNIVHSKDEFLSQMFCTTG